MGKAMTKSQIAEHLAKKVDIKKSQAAAILDEIAKLAYKETKNSFTLPGIGKIVLMQRKAPDGQEPSDGAGDKDPGQKGRQVQSRESCKGRYSGQEITPRKELQTLHRVIPFRKEDSWLSCEF